MTPTTPSPISDQAAGDLTLIKAFEQLDHIDRMISNMTCGPDDYPTEEIYAALRALDGISQEALDGGWIALGLSNYAKNLEGKLAALSTATTTGSAPEVAECKSCGASPDSWLCPHSTDKRAKCHFAAPASPAASVPHPSIARVIAQEERACRAEDALIDLVNQIRKSNPVDDHGHDLKMNRAYLESVKLLDAGALLAASMGGDTK